MQSVRLILFFALAVLASASYTNKDVSRTIDITTHAPRHTIRITAVKSGGAESEKYLVALPAASAAHLSYISASAEDGTDLAVTAEAPADAKKDTVYHGVSFGSVKDGSSTTFTLYLVFSHVLTPLPKKIAQADNQKVVFEDNHFFYSPYATQSQRTEVKLGSSSVESHSEEKPTQNRGKDLAYGPYSDKAAFSVSPLRVHYENNSPFFAATTLVREVEVSFWGNVAVEEHYDIRHTGAELKGFFSRLDMQRSQTGNAPAAIRQFSAQLPQGAADVYYRDVIGNISTSHVREGDNGPVFEIIPRFPVFGGWKVQFYFGYNLPLPQYVFSDRNGLYHLNITYASPIENIVVDDYVLKVILPEGSSIKGASAALFSVGDISYERRFTYLDREGRPVIVFHKKNVVADHDVHFVVDFTFNQLYRFHEFFLLFVGFFALFFACILRVRLFESSNKLAVAIREIAEIHSLRSEARSELIRAHKAGKGEADLKKKVEEVKNKLASFAADARAVEATLASLGAEAASHLAAARKVHADEVKLDESFVATFSAPVADADVKQLTARDAALERALPSKN